MASQNQQAQEDQDRSQESYFSVTNLRNRAEQIQRLLEKARQDRAEADERNVSLRNPVLGTRIRLLNMEIRCFNMQLSHVGMALQRREKKSDSSKKEEILAEKMESDETGEFPPQPCEKCAKGKGERPCRVLKDRTGGQRCNNCARNHVQCSLNSRSRPTKPRPKACKDGRVEKSGARPASSSRPQKVQKTGSDPSPEQEHATVPASENGSSPGHESQQDSSTTPPTSRPSTGISASDALTSDSPMGIAATGDAAAAAMASNNEAIQQDQQPQSAAMSAQEGMSVSGFAQAALKNKPGRTPLPERAPPRFQRGPQISRQQQKQASKPKPSSSNPGNAAPEKLSSGPSSGAVIQQQPPKRHSSGWTLINL